MQTIDRNEANVIGEYSSRIILVINYDCVLYNGIAHKTKPRSNMDSINNSVTALDK